MRTRETVEKDFKKLEGEFCKSAHLLILELLLDIRDSLKRKHGRKLTEQQKKKLRKGLANYWKKVFRGGSA